MAFLMIFALIGAYWFYFRLGYTEVRIPMFGTIHISYLYIPLFIFIFISAANSVNITDGLDGLA
jgi:phospho-N-acetylmuramoyl-pentapeptide-transferase